MNLNEFRECSILRVFVTGEYVTDESAAHGDAAERGWTTDVGARYFEESRNYVSPTFEARVVKQQGDTLLISDDTWTDGGNWRDDHEQMLLDLSEIIGPREGRHSDDGSTVYLHREWDDFENGGVRTYAVHANVKHYSHQRGWVEDDVDIVTLVDDAIAAGIIFA